MHLTPVSYNTNYNSNSNPNFTSTLIRLKGNDRLLKEYLDPIYKCFELKGFGDETAEVLRKKIDLSQAAIGIGEEGMLVVGKDQSADRFIGRVLKKVDDTVKFVDDAPEMKVEGPVIDLTELDILV